MELGRKVAGKVPSKSGNYLISVPKFKNSGPRPGIPEGELKSVFDKFFQSAITKSSVGGNGLGLLICREIIAAHSGQNKNPTRGLLIELILGYLCLKNYHTRGMPKSRKPLYSDRKYALSKPPTLVTGP